MPNKRIMHAHHQVKIKRDGGGSWVVGHGVQSTSFSANSQLEDVFVVGQLQQYQNIEGLPQIEFTINKVLDGYPLIFCLASADATTPTISARGNTKCLIAVDYFADTSDSATGTPLIHGEVSGAFFSNVQYTFPVDGNFTEQVTFAANNLVFSDDPDMTQDDPWTLDASPDGAFDTNNDSPLAVEGVNRRQHINFDPVVFTSDVNSMNADPDCTILPPEIDGISSSGTNNRNADDTFKANIQSITVSCTINREELLQLGRRGPYYRPIQYPIEATCEITTLSTSGRVPSMTEDGILTAPGNTNPCLFGGNLSDRTIRIATCEGTRIYLGSKNKMQSYNVSGGDAGGGNLQVSYTYASKNSLTILHSSNPEAVDLWTGREDYLTTV